jgi:predicted molibdopterin-dependent oxidoreductase YjgC
MAPASDLATGTLATTVCPFCGTGCGVLLEDAAAYPILSDSVARGGLCLRGWSAGELLRSPLRVMHTRVRSRGDPLRPAPAEATLLSVADRIRTIREQHGGSSIGILASARITLEESRLLVDLARCIGTPHLDSFQRLGCTHSPGVSLAAIAEASRILVIGTDLAARHPQVARRVLEAHARGATVRYLGSRRAQHAPLVSGSIACPPGGEVEASGPAMAGELVLWSSDLALHGQAGPALRRLGARGAGFLADYANQRALLESGAYPQDGGLSAYEMLTKAAAGELRALLVFADDPFEFFPDLAARAFARLELVVVVDAVATRTTQAADVVLPGALLAEKEGTLVGLDGGEHALEPVQASPAGLSEGEIARWLLRLLAGGDGHHPAPRPFAPGPDGAAPDAPTADYPIIAGLDTSTLWNGHALVRASVTARREAWGSQADLPSGYVSLSVEDAKALKVRTGTPLKIESDAGSLVLGARVDARTLEGTLGIPMSCWERAGSALGALALDPCLRIPVFRPRAVRLSRS